MGCSQSKLKESLLDFRNILAAPKTNTLAAAVALKSNIIILDKCAPEHKKSVSPSLYATIAHWCLSITTERVFFIWWNRLVCQIADWYTELWQAISKFYKDVRTGHRSFAKRFTRSSSSVSWITSLWTTEEGGKQRQNRSLAARSCSGSGIACRAGQAPDAVRKIHYRPRYPGMYTGRSFLWHKH